ncbi:hypothetical protein K440DRAFT_615673 [Wilcoxina mikolae CBS 423.85]|nr:hypothetical protein K440DRAFT_615673 [Wilcoxina mikolae CBS 423.85]
MPDPYSSLNTQVARLHALTNAMRTNHTTLRQQNDKVVKTALAMEASLKPVEDGLRIEMERKAAEDAASRVGNSTANMEDEEEVNEGVVGV